MRLRIYNLKIYINIIYIIKGDINTENIIIITNANKQLTKM